MQLAGTDSLMFHVAYLCDACYTLLCSQCAMEDTMGLGHVKQIMEAGVEWSNPTEKLLAVTVAYYSDRKAVCRSTMAELGEVVGIGRRRVSDLIDGLCEKGVLVRLGHGRYGVSYDLAEAGEQRSVQPKGSAEELARLQASRGADEGIVFTKDGWPVLQPLSKIRGE